MKLKKEYLKMILKNENREINFKLIISKDFDLVKKNSL